MTTGPTVEDQLTVFAIIRGFIDYDGEAIRTLLAGADDTTIGLAATAAQLTVWLAKARGTAPAAILDQLVAEAVTAGDTR